MDNQRTYKITVNRIFKKLLPEGGHEFVLYSGEEIVSSTEKRIIDLVNSLKGNLYYLNIVYNQVNPKQTFTPDDLNTESDLEHKVLSISFEELIGYKVYNMRVNSTETVYTYNEFSVYARNETEARNKAHELATNGTLTTEWVVDDADSFAITDIEIQD